MQIKEISQDTVSQIKEVIRRDLISYIPLYGAIAVILKEEIEDREILEFAIENHTKILEIINKESDYFAIKKDADGNMCFVIDIADE